MLKMTLWLVQEKKLRVFVEPVVYEEQAIRLCRDSEQGSLCDMVRPWYGAATDTDRTAALETNRDQPPAVASSHPHGTPERIDFIITLGGDGTVLYGMVATSGEWGRSRGLMVLVQARGGDCGPGGGALVRAGMWRRSFSGRCRQSSRSTSGLSAS